jgi:hypothetical protein
MFGGSEPSQDGYYEQETTEHKTTIATRHSQNGSKTEDVYSGTAAKAEQDAKTRPPCPYTADIYYNFGLEYIRQWRSGDDKQGD